jgi:hypothetical protein
MLPSEPTKPEVWYSIQFISTWAYYKDFRGADTPSTKTVERLVDADKMTLDKAKHLTQTLYQGVETQIVVNPYISGK